MTIFTSYTIPKERKIIYEPRSGADMEKATKGLVPLHKYSDLCKFGQIHGPLRMLSHLFRNSSKHIVLLQDPSNMDSGHWLSVSCNKPKKEIYFFSTYGGKPDVEKISWMKEDDLLESGQIMNIFNDGMKELQNHGWKIYYNDYPYQKNGDNTAVCGIYTAAFLNSNLNPDQFEEQTLHIARMGINPALYYYYQYFV